MTRVRRLSESEKRLLAQIGAMATNREIGQARLAITEAIRDQNQAAVLYALVGQLVLTAFSLSDRDVGRALEITEAMLLHFRAARVKE